MGDPMYERRLIDADRERRMRTLEEKVDQLDDKVDALSNRLSWLFGALAMVSVLANIVGPVIANAIANR